MQTSRDGFIGALHRPDKANKLALLLVWLRVCASEVATFLAGVYLPTNQGFRHDSYLGPRSRFPAD